MSEGCGHVLEHAEKIAANESRSKSNTIRLGEQADMLKIMHTMNNNISVIAEQIKNQGMHLASLVDTLKEHEAKMDTLENKMETKETVQRMQEKINAIENRPTVTLQYAEIGKKFIMWLLFSLILGTIFLFVVAIILAMIKQASFPAL